MLEKLVRRACGSDTTTPAAYVDNPKPLTEPFVHATAVSFGNARAVIRYDDRETQFINIFA